MRNIAHLVLLACGIGILLGVFAFFSVLANQRDAAQAIVSLAGKTFSVLIADTAIERTRGLSGRPSLREDEGMLFLFESPGAYGFWMKGMRFPIDIVWIRGDRVVGITEHVPVPTSALNLPTYYPPEPVDPVRDRISNGVDAVLEINAGLAARHGFQIGDVLTRR
ncbi:MAG: DUF192 domain-containing protein [Candidatus Liptonbacteria bacterium]|nr:DUF192 domain-containing protein [Candidatus Liptonbacteria bacterium]